MNNQNRDDLIQYLLNFAFDHKIGYQLVNADPYNPSLSFKQHRYMIINLNWHNQNEVPFIIGHEIGHLMLGGDPIMYYGSFSAQNSEEKEADLYSLKLIYRFSDTQGDEFDSPHKFVQSYGIPSRMNKTANDIFKNAGK